jgi:hypothetical protein
LSSKQEPTKPKYPRCFDKEKKKKTLLLGAVMTTNYAGRAGGTGVAFKCWLQAFQGCGG